MVWKFLLDSKTEQGTLQAPSSVSKEMKAAFKSTEWVAHQISGQMRSNFKHIWKAAKSTTCYYPRYVHYDQRAIYLDSIKDGFEHEESSGNPIDTCSTQYKDRTFYPSGTFNNSAKYSK